MGAPHREGARGALPGRSRTRPRRRRVAGPADSAPGRGRRGAVGRRGARAHDRDRRSGHGLGERQPGRGPRARAAPAEAVAAARRAPGRRDRPATRRRPERRTGCPACGLVEDALRVQPRAAARRSRCAARQGRVVAQPLAAARALPGGDEPAPAAGPRAPAESVERDPGQSLAHPWHRRPVRSSGHSGERWRPVRGSPDRSRSAALDAVAVGPVAAAQVGDGPGEPVHPGRAAAGDSAVRQLSSSSGAPLVGQRPGGGERRDRARRR